MINFVEFTAERATKRDQRMIDRAARIASTSQMRHKHGALLVMNGNIRAVGINTKQNEPKPWVPYDYLSNHAEMNTLQQIPHQLIDGTLYVVRVNNAGVLLPSLPCDNCLGYIIKWTRLRRVVHS